MVARDILLAEVTGARYHVAHISSRHSVEMVAFAKTRGLSVTAEATPHHLDAGGSRHDALRQQLQDEAAAAIVRRRGTQCSKASSTAPIDAIATDHAPHPGSEKMQEFEKCPFGILGLETAIGVSLERLLGSGKISIKRYVELFTVNPARILGLDRGTLAAGAPADVTIFSTTREWTYDVNKSFSKSRNSPFDGRTFRGGPVATVVAGRIVWTCM